MLLANFLTNVQQRGIPLSSTGPFTERWTRSNSRAATNDKKKRICYGLFYQTEFSQPWPQLLSHDQQFACHSGSVSGDPDKNWTREESSKRVNNSSVNAPSNVKYIIDERTANECWLKF